MPIFLIRSKISLSLSFPGSGTSRYSMIPGFNMIACRMCVYYLNKLSHQVTKKNLSNLGDFLVSLWLYN